ncbi:hypothetical protein CEXT_24991 [Caerostris extrusa]|uniref:Uncharacterized protein n=1 Tax=Caerostris extrusa TaxID=172846 RepID=A0AAV4XNY7_CAEEX|nr:hypothetical protein CEXT_24991 [Caerostris extrusa]
MLTDGSVDRSVLVISRPAGEAFCNLTVVSPTINIKVPTQQILMSSLDYNYIEKFWGTDSGRLGLRHLSSELQKVIQPEVQFRSFNGHLD